MKLLTYVWYAFTGCFFSLGHFYRVSLVVARSPSTTGFEISKNGPIWPETFTVNFHEILVSQNRTLSENKGVWYYDFKHLSARHDHLEGQKNNFCQGQHLSTDNPSDDCNLIFAPSGGMYVHYPNAKECCKLCEDGIGCSVLKPTWISNGDYLGTEDVIGNTCHVYHETGAVAEDYWLQTQDDIPCRYYESLGFPGRPTVHHNLTFDRDSYSNQVIDSIVFSVPLYCNQNCPNPYGSGSVNKIT
mmetsp:Transcript_2156/g.3028  ORF Transcript_2156/g.3028 Transcript_2156/m.3028 type:complete len:244 (+) Transcript_2156:300-1031(+)